MNHHVVICLLQAKPDKLEILKAKLRDIAELSTNEPGCIAYNIYEADNNTVILHEKWESAEIHKQQFSKPYILKFMEEMDDLLSHNYQGYFAKEI